MNILITSAGRRVSLVRAFQKELKKIYPSAAVIAADAQPKLSAACHVADSYFQVPRLDNSNYIKEVINKCLELDIKLIIPTIDTELLLLSKNRTLIEENGITPIIASVEFIEKCRDKRVIHEKTMSYPCL